MPLLASPLQLTARDCAGAGEEVLPAHDCAGAGSEESLRADAGASTPRGVDDDDDVGGDSAARFSAQKAGDV
jgi:hypothetical protein